MLRKTVPEEACPLQQEAIGLHGWAAARGGHQDKWTRGAAERESLTNTGVVPTSTSAWGKEGPCSICGPEGTRTRKFSPPIS